MNKLEDSFNSIKQHYFQIMSKNSTESKENRLNSLRILKTDFLKFYSPSYDQMHVRFLGLVNDVISIFENEISINANQVVKTSVTQPQKIQSVTHEVINIEAPSSFGATVYLDSELKEVDCRDLNIDIHFDLDDDHKDYRFSFDPKDFLLDKKLYDIPYNTYANYYAFSYNFIVDKYFKHKEKFYPNIDKKVPQFFELFYNLLPQNLDQYHMIDFNFRGNYDNLWKIVKYVENTSVCFTSFVFNYLVAYHWSTNEKNQKEKVFHVFLDENDFTEEDTSYEGHAVTFLIYRNGLQVDIIVIDNNSYTDDGGLGIILKFISNFIAMFSNKNLIWNET